MKNESIAIVIQLLLVRKKLYILNNPLYLKVHLLLVDWLFSIYLPKTKGLVSNLSSDDLRVGPLGFDKHFPAVDGVPIHIFQGRYGRTPGEICWPCSCSPWQKKHMHPQHFHALCLFQSRISVGLPELCSKTEMSFHLILVG